MFERTWKTFGAHQALMLDDTSAIAALWWDESPAHAWWDVSPKWRWAVFSAPRSAASCLEELTEPDVRIGGTLLPTWRDHRCELDAEALGKKHIATALDAIETADAWTFGSWDALAASGLLAITDSKCAPVAVRFTAFFLDGKAIHFHRNVLDRSQGVTHLRMVGTTTADVEELVCPPPGGAGDLLVWPRLAPPAPSGWWTLSPEEPPEWMRAHVLQWINDAHQAEMLRRMRAGETPETARAAVIRERFTCSRLDD